MYFYVYKIVYLEPSCRPLLKPSLKAPNKHKKQYIYCICNVSNVMCNVMWSLICQMMVCFTFLTSVITRKTNYKYQKDKPKKKKKTIYASYFSWNIFSGLRNVFIYNLFKVVGGLTDFQWNKIWCLADEEMKAVIFLWH